MDLQGRAVALNAGSTISGAATFFLIFRKSEQLPSPVCLKTNSVTVARRDLETPHEKADRLKKKIEEKQGEIQRRKIDIPFKKLRKKLTKRKSEPNEPIKQFKGPKKRKNRETTRRCMTPTGTLRISGQILIPGRTCHPTHRGIFSRRLWVLE
ncbi:hypothetical protein ABFS83_08G066400 [Erythranthe nasuta]